MMNQVENIELLQILNNLGYNPKLIKLKGYSHTNKQSDPQKRYDEGKTPGVKKWKDEAGEIIPIPEEEIAPWVECGGWLGMTIPEGAILIDIDDDTVGQAISIGILRQEIQHIGIKTPHGYQFIFAENGKKITQAAKMITLAGIIADYRVAGRGYIVLPIWNTKGRTVFHADGNLSTIPAMFYPVRKYLGDKDIDKLLPVPLSQGRRNCTMLSHLCRLREWNMSHNIGLTEDDKKKIAEEINGILLDPPLDSRELQNLIRSANSYATISTPSKSDCSTTEEYGDNEKSDVIGEYFIKGEYLCKERIVRVGRDSITQAMPLCNFDIRITRRIMEDDGTSILSKMAVSGTLLPYTKLKEIEILAANFSNPQKWIYLFNKNLIIEPSVNTRDLVRHAIEVRSTDTQEITVFAHTGWRMIDGAMHYLSGNGSLFDNNIYVKLSQENERYQLPSNNNIDEIEAIKTSLSFMDVAKSEVSIPLWIFTYLSTLTSELGISPNFSTYVFGETGKFKTALTILALAHFGDFKDSKQLPSFRDTINSCEKRAFTLKDTLMVVDDYHPTSNAIEASKMEQLAQFLVRAFGNRTARGRLNSDSSDKGRFSPRGLLIITGEELVALQSTLARIMLLTVEEGTVNQNRLTELQRKADHLPYAMASFLRWTRANLSEIKKKFDDTFFTIRNSLQNVSHKRLSEQITFMVFMTDIIALWLVDRGVFDIKMAKDFVGDAKNIFFSNADKLNRRLLQDDPAEQFMEMLRTIILQKRVKIEHIKDKTKSFGGFNNTIGYYDDANTYMLTTAVFHELGSYCAQERQHFPFHRNTTLEMLKRRGLIAGYNIQKNIRGKNMKCMIVPLSILRGENIKEED